MAVHERTGGPPTHAMELTENRACDVPDIDDPEWVAGLLDMMADGDPDDAAEVLEQLARRLRKAAKARNALAQVSTASLRAAMELRVGRRSEEQSWH
jgi:hypothetical protein